MWMERCKILKYKKIVDFTHNQLPWSVTDDKEIIPYVLITQEDPQNVY